MNQWTFQYFYTDVKLGHNIRTWQKITHKINEISEK
jgi:hypothetical protein